MLRTETKKHGIGRTVRSENHGVEEKIERKKQGRKKLMQEATSKNGKA